MFAWTDDLSVGCAILDADHKAFLDLAQLLHDSKEGGDRMLVLSALAMLEEYVDGHFLREEKAMHAVEYPRLASHRMRHGLFRARIKARSELYRQGTASALDELAGMVVDWLRGHIRTEDAQYKNWITDSVVDGRPLGLLVIEAYGINLRQGRR